MYVEPSPPDPNNETLIIVFVAGFAVGACCALLFEFFACHA